MLRIALAPCAPFSVSEDLMRRTAELAREHGLRLHTHLAETKDEETYCQQVYGCRPVEFLRRLGWLGDDVWLAHCVHLSPEEIRLFGETGTGVAHCPTSNFRLGSGIAPVREMLDAGVPVGLGVDGSASNDSSNMLAELRQALLAHRQGRDPERWLTAEDVFWMATRGGARCLGRDDIGSLEPGKAADLVLDRHAPALLRGRGQRPAGVARLLAVARARGHGHGQRPDRGRTRRARGRRRAAARGAGRSGLRGTPRRGSPHERHRLPAQASTSATLECRR